MSAASIQTFLEDIRLASEARHHLVQAVRALVAQRCPGVEEALKYGGILFSAEGLTFGGVFAYKAHVSVEFGSGARIADAFGHLEGQGKGRRHLKLRGPEDLLDKQLAAYLPLALQAAKEERAAP